MTRERGADEERKFSRIRHFEGGDEDVTEISKRDSVADQGRGKGGGNAPPFSRAAFACT